MRVDKVGHLFLLSNGRFGKLAGNLVLALTCASKLLIKDFGKDVFVGLRFRGSLIEFLVRVL